MPVPSLALRELLLAAQVLDDVDLEIGDHGIVLTGGLPVRVRWSSLLTAVAGAPLRSALARTRVVNWLATRRQLSDLPMPVLTEQVRAVGLPRGHVLLPGRDWAQREIMGDALVLGIGVLGLDPDRPDEVAIVPASIWRAAQIAPGPLWAACAAHLEQMGLLAADRWRLGGQEVLRPMGGCDVPTLLGARSLRSALAQDAGGMRAVMAPMRNRGWTDLHHLDAAFGPAAAMATDPVDRGFLRPVLVTADEVVLAAAGRGGQIGNWTAAQGQVALAR